MLRVIFLILSALSLDAKTPAKQAEKKETAVKKASKNLSVDELVKAIQKQYNNTTSLTFDFEQNYKNPFLTESESSEGQVAYDRAMGNMLWSYLKPEGRQKKFYINGSELTYYSVSGNIAYVNKCYQQDTLSASLAFLQGFGKIKDSFTPSLLKDPTPNKDLQWLKLAPKEKNTPVKFIYLGVKDGSVLESIVEDPTGGKNHFKFKHFNTLKIDKGTFTFTAPKGVIVEPMPNVVCPEVKKKEEKKAPAKKATKK